VITSPQELPLRDIHLPDPVSWWPPAPGWWLVALAAGVLAVLIFMRLGLAQRSRSVKEDSRRRLELLAMEYRQHRDQQRLLRELSSLLRRVSLSCYGRTEVASLTGEAWLKLLDRPLGTEDFRHGPGRILAAGPYQPAATVDVQGLLELCREWIHALPEPIR
jgi:hypothetical protein